ncbi:MAG: DUF748 domain-containing protein [Bacteroidales bacterium]|nr:DUF748 domain-containing protein [Bacteroidales bacterium]
MPDETPNGHKPQFARHIVKALMMVLIVISVVFISAFIAMNYFGETFIKTFLQSKIRQTSHGVYEIDFNQFHFNLLSGKTSITGFKLIPNEERYEKLREEGKAKGTLYSVTYEKLVLNNLSLKEIFFDRAIHLRMIEVEKPIISFIAFPDSTARKRGRFKHIYQDLYPLLSKVFKEVRIDSIRVNDGSFSGKQTLKSGMTMEGDWLYSAVLRDFDLNAYDYKEERVFYSKDVELRIRNFNYALSDSLYFLTADEVGFSLTGSRLFGQNLSLTPNFNSGKLAGAKAGSFYQVHLPDFSIYGVDLYKAILKKEISINSMNIDNLDVSMFLHKQAEPVAKKQRTKVTIASLYTIIQDKLKNITIDTFLLSNASFRFYPEVNIPRPELEVDRATLELQGFYLDSVAHLDTTKILYSRDIEFDLEGFTLALQDKLHDLNAQQVIISTKRSLIDIYNTRLYPSPSTDSAYHYKSNTLYRMMFPQVKLEQINLLRMFNTRNLEFGRLAIFEPDLTIIQYRDKKVPEDSANQKETFLQKLDIGRSVVMPYMVSIEAGTIEVSNARISFKDDKEGLNEVRIDGLVDLTLTGFMIDTLTHHDRKEFLNRLELDLELRDFHYLSPDSLHRITVKELFVNSLSQELDVTDFNMLTTSRMHPGMPYPSTFAAQFKALQVHGFDHRKWIGEKWFSAGDIRIQEPEIVIRSVKRKTKSSLNESFSDIDDAVSKIEIGSIMIDKGWFDLVEEDQKSTGSVLVRNFDFQLSKFLFDLTGWDQGEKILRYDLLSLRPDSAMPILLDSIYSISFSRFLSDSYPPDIIISNLHVVPMEPGIGKSRKPVTIELSLPSFILRHLNLEQVLFDRDLRIEEIEIAHPEITLNRYSENQGMMKTKKTALSSHPELKTPFLSMEIGNVVLTDGVFHYKNGDTDSSTTLSLDGINTTIHGFSYDSTHSQKKASTLFFCDDIELETGGYSLITKDSMNTLSIAGLHLSTGHSTLAIDSFALTPNFSDSLYSRKLGYQTDRMEVVTGTIELERLDFKTLLEEKKLIAGLVYIHGVTLDDYRDKRVNFPYWKRPPMIQQAIRKLSFPVTIDTLSLTNGQVTYREQDGKEPGMIFFNRMEVLARNFTTDSLLIEGDAELVAHGSTYLMGKAKVEGEFRFPLQSPSDTFYFRGRAGMVEMPLFNPMVSKVAPVKIKSGVVDSVNIHWMRGNGTYANGLLDLYYQGLSIELLKEKKDFWNKTGTSLLQLLVNMAVPQENPGYFGIHRSGYIWNRRDEEKGFFNFFWKSLLTGLMSSEGLNSKEQRAFKRSLKREMKQR